MEFVAGQTAIIIPVPEAESAMSRWREKFDDSARAGVPAHVTVIAPFLLLDRIAAVVQELSELVNGFAAFEATFSRFDEFPGVLYLAPDDGAPFSQLTEAVARRWPEAPPYAGEVEDPIPHLTVAVGQDPATVADIVRDATAYLPLVSWIGEAWLLWFDGRTWSRAAVLPLGGAERSPR